MRVTWLTLEWPREGVHVGGVARYVYRMAEAMRGLVDLSVVVPNDSVPLESVRLIELDIKNSRVDRYYAAPFRASKKVHETQPDVVHAHGDDWALRTSAPRVRTFYGSSWGEARSSSGLRAANHALLSLTELVSSMRAEVNPAIAPESSDRFGALCIVPRVLVAPTRLARRPTSRPTVAFVGNFDGRKRGWMVQAAIQSMRADSGRDISLWSIRRRTIVSGLLGWIIAVGRVPTATTDEQ